MKPLRGHHMFCMALFSGHGYDEAFTQNMSALIEEGRLGGRFRLVQGHDAVCGACPNRQGDGGSSCSSSVLRSLRAISMRFSS